MIQAETSLALYDALKAVGVFGPEDDHSVIGFAIEAQIGQPIRLRVDRRVYGEDGTRAIAETLSRFERSDSSLTVPK